MKPQQVADHIEIANFRTTDANTIEEIADFCIRHMPAAGDLVHSVENSFAELMDNVVIHSESPVGGCFMAQYYPKLEKIKISFCDFGVSIPTHLGRKSEYQSLDDSELIEKAFEIGVSGADHQRSGMGMDFVRDFTVVFDGVLRVLSGSGHYRVDSTGFQKARSIVRFPGTIYNIDWPAN